MSPPYQIGQTKLTPPHLPPHILYRARLSHRLQEAQYYRLTLALAGTGYGKSTALTALAQESGSLAWYHLGSEDVDPQTFLLYLHHALSTAVPELGAGPLTFLEQWDGNQAMWTAVTDSLANELAVHLATPLILVIDDAHLANQSSFTLRILDRFISHAPHHLHIILAARYPVQLPSLVNWRVHGQVLEIGQTDFAFTTPEIEALYRQQYDWELTPEQVALLAERSEGWPIALYLVWQRLSSGRVSLPEAVGQLSGGDLFTYLAQEVLSQQPADIQAFLQDTAVLRNMTAAICDTLRHRHDSYQFLDYLRENGLFIVDLGNGHLRYHHLFRDFLCHQLAGSNARNLNLQAARIYQAQEQFEEAVYHFLAAEAYKEAAALLVKIGREMVQAGRFNTLSGWIAAFPPEILAEYPPLLIYLGDIARLHSHFEEALGWYQQAEARSASKNDIPGVGQALRGQARVYLDTVNPRQAEQLLQEALRLADGQTDRASQAKLLELLAENMLNQGRMKQAEKLRRQAQEMQREGPGEADLPIRVLLRTGKLTQARQLLEKQATVEEREPVLHPRAHRETLLLLSLILTMQGEADKARETAVAGTERGQILHSPFVTAVGYMRQGHAWLLQKNAAGFAQAERCFLRAVQMSETLDIPRLKVEAFWGLCQVYGFRNDLSAAKQAAEQGLGIARAAGDEWVMACLRVTLGASYVLSKKYQEALEWLNEAFNSYRECGDTYGETIVTLWRCFIWQQTDDSMRLERDVDRLLQLVQTHDYAYLFKKRTLLGPPDVRQLVPLLLFAQAHDRHAAFAEKLLTDLGLKRLQIHPGYQLRGQLLGPFRLWRGRDEVPQRAWRRQKARQLLLLLFTQRPNLLHREQICELLWPELPPKNAQRDFKVAYNALVKVLEPERRRNAPSAFIVRDGARYGLRPEADIWLDTAVFETLVTKGNSLYREDPTAALPLYRQALALYQGDYLQEYPYAEWCSEERERLLTLYLRAVERLATAVSAQELWSEVIELAQLILARDNCWENAYRLQMQAYAQLGNRTQIKRTYQRCVQCLQEELDVAPSPATTELYHSLK